MLQQPRVLWLKASLKARLTGPDWMDELPLVLLGLRSVPKEDLGCAPSELVYGTTIRLPGEFFEATKTSTEPNVSDLLTRLRATMARLQPHPIVDNTLHICPTPCKTVHSFLFAMTLIVLPCRAPMMDLSEYLRETSNTSP